MTPNFSVASRRSRPFRHEIFHSPGLAESRPLALRLAVRAVIVRGAELLLIHAPDKGEYKFPGGGIEDGEDPLDALRREVREEAGAEMVRVVRRLGQVVEYSVDKSGAAAVFKMVSTYFLAEIGAAGLVQRLDDYEAELRFTPVWVAAAAAVAADAACLASRPGASRWIKRELWVLRRLAARPGLVR